MKTLTVKAFAKLLNGLLRSGQIKATDKIYLASDEEGNSFSRLIDQTEISFGIEKGKIILYPIERYETCEECK